MKKIYINSVETGTKCQINSEFHENLSNVPEEFYINPVETRVFLIRLSEIMIRFL